MQHHKSLTISHAARARLARTQEFRRTTYHEMEHIINMNIRRKVEEESKRGKKIVERVRRLV